MIVKLYSKLPKAIQDRIRSVFDLVPLPYRYGVKFARIYTQVNKWGKSSNSELENYQNEQLGKMLRHCYENVPYYRNIFNHRGLRPDDLRSKHDLKKLPIITKAEMQKNFTDFVAEDSAKFNPVTMSTSGTTGTPFKFYQDENNILYERAFVLRYFALAGMRPNQKLAVLRSYVPEKGAPLWKKYGSMIYFSAYDMTPANMRLYYDSMRTLGIEYLRGYPTSVFAFAKFVSSNNLNLKLKGVFTSSEALFPNYRDVVKTAFSCEVYDLYGSGEHVAFLDQCNHDGVYCYHENPEYSVTEIVDENGDPVAEEGIQGRIVGTSLHSFSMPFLRYQIADYALFTKKKCHCGRQFLAQSILGRIDDYLTTPNGKIVSGVNFYTVFYKIPSVLQFQIIQETLKDVTVNLIVDSSYDNNVEEALLKSLYARLDESMNISVKKLSEFEREVNSSKIRCIISKIKK